VVAALIWLAIGLGGALGACSRAAVALLAVELGLEARWEFLAVQFCNVVGAGLMGWLAYEIPKRFGGAPGIWESTRWQRPATVRTELTERVAAFTLVGFLGGFTTWSSWVAHVVTASPDWLPAVYDALVTPIAGVLAAKWGVSLAYWADKSTS